MFLVWADFFTGALRATATLDGLVFFVEVVTRLAATAFLAVFFCAVFAVFVDLEDAVALAVDFIVREPLVPAVFLTGAAFLIAVLPVFGDFFGILICAHPFTFVVDEVAAFCHSTGSQTEP